MVPVEAARDPVHRQAMSTLFEFYESEVGLARRIVPIFYEQAIIALRNRARQRWEIGRRLRLFSDIVSEKTISDAVVTEFWHEFKFEVIDVSAWRTDPERACTCFMNEPWKPDTSVTRINKILNRLSRGTTTPQTEPYEDEDWADNSAVPADVTVMRESQKRHASRLLRLAVADLGEDSRWAQAREIGGALIDLFESSAIEDDQVDWIPEPNTRKNKSDRRDFDLGVNAAQFAAWLNTRGVRVSDKTAGKAWAYYCEALRAALAVSQAEI